MPSKPAYAHTIERQIALLEARIGNLLLDIERLDRSTETQRTEVQTLRKEYTDTKEALSNVTQRLDDHLKRVETWSGRLWTLVTILIGAVLSLAAGLIVALAKK